MPAPVWILRPRIREQAARRLFCFPYAGGGASIYVPWTRSEALASVEICPVQLPGRESRLREKPEPDMDRLAEAVAAGIEPFLDRPYAFFGHSMGGLIAFEVARRIEARGLRPPERLFISAARPPPDHFEGDALHRLPQGRFIEVVQARYGGIPEEVLRNPELVELIEPMLRADFQLIETYQCREGAPLRTPLSVFGGIDDGLVPAALLAGWQRHAARPPTFKTFAGGHFFLNPAREELLREIAALLPLPLGEAVTA